MIGEDEEGDGESGGGCGCGAFGAGKRKGVASSGEELGVGRKLTLVMGGVMEMREGMKRRGRDVDTIEKMMVDLGDVMEGEGARFWEGCGGVF